VTAFAPATVKVQVTGFGRAEKAQVALMVSRLLDLDRDVAAGDACDALAVALCHAHLHGMAREAQPAKHRRGGIS
jgi:crossover junction endodeoxyribonuclease RuvC